MKTILFSLPGNEELTELLAKKMDAEIGKATLRKFPDGESYTRILSDVKDKCVVLVCTLHEPDKKLLPLYFLNHLQHTCYALFHDAHKLELQIFV